LYEGYVVELTHISAGSDELPVESEKPVRSTRRRLRRHAENLVQSAHQSLRDITEKPEADEAEPLADATAGIPQTSQPKRVEDSVGGRATKPIAAGNPNHSQSPESEARNGQLQPYKEHSDDTALWLYHIVFSSSETEKPDHASDPIANDSNALVLRDIQAMNQVVSRSTKSAQVVDNLLWDWTKLSEREIDETSQGDPPNPQREASWELQGRKDASTNQESRSRAGAFGGESGPVALVTAGLAALDAKRVVDDRGRDQSSRSRYDERGPKNRVEEATGDRRESDSRPREDERRPEAPGKGGLGYRHRDGLRTDYYSDDEYKPERKGARSNSARAFLGEGDALRGDRNVQNAKRGSRGGSRSPLPRTDRSSDEAYTGRKAFPHIEDYSDSEVGYYSKKTVVAPVSKPRPSRSEKGEATNIQKSAMAALIAGAAEAFRVSKEPGDWDLSGKKTKRVLTAAVGAASVDAAMDSRRREEESPGRRT
jgi:hypothetical protein